jgi:hypothetical protein
LKEFWRLRSAVHASSCEAVCVPPHSDDVEPEAEEATGALDGAQGGCHGPFGILNEEAFESIHAHMNNLLRRFACVRDRNLRDRLMHTAFCVLQATKADTDKMILAGKRKMKKQRPNPDLAALG